MPLAIGDNALDEVVVEAYRVVRILARDGEVGLGIPVRVIGPEVDGGIALARELDDPLNIILWDHRAARGTDLALKRRVSRRDEAIVAQRLALDTGQHDQAEM